MSFRLLILSIVYFTASSGTTQREGCSTKTRTVNPILKIIYSTTGGRGGNYENLEISSDSLMYLQARRGEEKTIKAKTSKEFWDEITGNINLEDFNRIKSDPGHALYDGIDITITIETTKETHSLVNGHEDTLSYKKIQPFTDLLEKKLKELRPKIVWGAH